MPTFLSPVSLSEFQTYLNDTTTDTAILAFYQSLLDSATEKVYTFLNQDFTADAPKTDVFFGRSLHIHRMNYPAGALLSWKYYDDTGAETVADIADLALFANGEIVVAATKRFERGYEHRLRYTLPSTLTCPETVKQVIIEIAALIFEESKQGSGRFGIGTQLELFNSQEERYRYLDLSARHVAMLAPYRRKAV